MVRSLTMMGRLDSVCGQIGTNANPGTLGCSIGPSDESA